MMKFRGHRALRAQFPKGSVVQVKMLTERDNWIEVEGPVSEEAAKEIVRLAIGPTNADPSELPRTAKEG